MAGIEVVAPERLSSDERAATARLYVEAFRRKLRLPLGADPTDFVSAHLRPDRLLLARAAGAVVGVAGLRYDGEGFFDPEPPAFRGRYGLLGGVRAAGVAVDADVRAGGPGAARRARGPVGPAGHRRRLGPADGRGRARPGARRVRRDPRGRRHQPPGRTCGDRYGQVPTCQHRRRDLGQSSGT